MILGYTDHLIHTWHVDTCDLVINQHVSNNKLISNLLPLKSQVSHLWSLKLVFYLYWYMFYAIFNQHLDLISGMGAFVCELCGKEFTVRTNLTRHQKSHKNETFTCDSCNFTSHTKRSVNEHSDRVHSSVLYPCDQCAKSFTCKQNLKIHAKIHYISEKAFTWKLAI